MSDVVDDSAGNDVCGASAGGADMVGTEVETTDTTDTGVRQADALGARANGDSDSDSDTRADSKIDGGMGGDGGVGRVDGGGSRRSADPHMPTALSAVLEQLPRLFYEAAAWFLRSDAPVQIALAQ